MSKSPNIQEFLVRFPDDDACLDHLMRTRFGERITCQCGKDARYYRVKTRMCFECEFCGHQVHPMSGTPFERTRTSLKDWFYVMFLFCASRNGVAAKEVQRQIGVTYKTAWRMCRHIRIHMGYSDNAGPLGGPEGTGIVEIDDTGIGGKDKQDKMDKTVVLGMAERGGNIVARVIKDRTAASITPEVIWHVTPGARVMTDKARALNVIGKYYRRSSVNHMEREWVRGDVHVNSIESFWGNVKRGIKGTYIFVSAKHLPTYLCEFQYRHNLRKHPALMFETLLQTLPPALVPLKKADGQSAD